MHECVAPAADMEPYPHHGAAGQSVERVCHSTRTTTTTRQGPLVILLNASVSSHWLHTLHSRRPRLPRQLVPEGAYKVCNVVQAWVDLQCSFKGMQCLLVLCKPYVAHPHAAGGTKMVGVELQHQLTHGNALPVLLHQVEDRCSFVVSLRAATVQVSQ